MLDINKLYISYTLIYFALLLTLLVFYFIAKFVTSKLFFLKFISYVNCILDL